MLYFTQLIYIKAGKESIFHSFEDNVLPFLDKYNGQLLLRIRPNQDSIIEKNIESPYEIHLVSFASRNDFENYANDKERLKFLELKNESVSKIILIEGKAL